jgi:hypothetical protein
VTRSKTLLVVGCGAAKRDESVPARDLYTSTYFAKKREYAEVVGNDWRVLSAEHGLVDPYEVIEPYETSIDDLDEDELNKLAGDIGLSLIDLVGDELVAGQGFGEIVVLAGRRYLDPLRDRDTFAAGISETVTFPLQQDDLGGIGEQMAWLSKRVSRESAEQMKLVTDGGEQPSDGAYHIVCHSCDFEEIVGDDRALAAAKEELHQKRTEEPHDVEYAPIDGGASNGS